MRKNTKWRLSAVVFEKETKIYPVLKSPTHIEFIGIKKWVENLVHVQIVSAEPALKKLSKQGKNLRTLSLR
jgi:hypothetical protein